MVTYPKDWNYFKLEDLGHIQMCRRIFQNQTKEIGEIPFYKIGTFIGKADAYISRELYELYKRKYPYPEKGDILISASGTIGRTIIFNGKDSYFQDSNIVWLKVDKNLIDRQYLWWFYRSFPWRSLEGTTIQRLYNNIILKTDIYLPSIKEQKAIVETLNTFDNYIDDLTTLIEKKKAIRDAVLDDLTSGKIRLAGFNDNWRIVKLKEISNLITKGTTPLNKSGKGDINFIKVENIDKNTGLIKITQKITSTEHNGYLKRSILKENDILFSIAGTLGRVALINKNILPANTNQALSIIRLKSDVADYIKFYLLSESVKKYIKINPTIGAQPNLSLKQIGDIKIFLPTIKEQKIIAGILATMDEEIKNLQNERDKIIAIREGAMDKLLTGQIRLHLED